MARLRMLRERRGWAKKANGAWRPAGSITITTAGWICLLCAMCNGIRRKRFSADTRRRAYGSIAIRNSISRWRTRSITTKETAGFAMCRANRELPPTPGKEWVSLSATWMETESWMFLSLTIQCQISYFITAEMEGLKKQARRPGLHTTTMAWRSPRWAWIFATTTTTGWMTFLLPRFLTRHSRSFTTWVAVSAMRRIRAVSERRVCRGPGGAAGCSISIMTDTRIYSRQTDM